jgi:endonuclease YncB( thermonuclease family)
LPPPPGGTLAPLPPPSLEPVEVPPTLPGAGAPVDTEPAPVATERVVRAIDGDTLELDSGFKVRLIGIDTPERGECGYREATEVLAALVAGRDVVLVPGARTDQDRYGRLLRYVDVGGVDANLEMIRSGRAVSRYDSRDGYGRHPREDLYVATDSATASSNTC